MTETAERLKSELAQLSEQERAELAQFLLESLHDQEDPDTDLAWDAELQRRDDDIRSGRAVGRPADQVLKELREKHT